MKNVENVKTALCLGNLNATWQPQNKGITLQSKRVKTSLAAIVKIIQKTHQVHVPEAKHRDGDFNGFSTQQTISH